jgi:hypothetical protein
MMMADGLLRPGPAVYGLNKSRGTEAAGRGPDIMAGNDRNDGRWQGI